MSEEKRGPLSMDSTDKADGLRSEQLAPDLTARPYRVSVEIPCFVLYYCTAVTGTVLANVLLHRTCVHKVGQTDEYCQLLQQPGTKPSDIQALETDVQKFTTVINMVKAILDGVVPAILALFLGAWSNKYGRKPLVVWSSFGFALSNCLLLVYCYAESLGPWWYVVTSLPYAFFGAGPAFTTGAFCLLNDVTSEKNRTLRLSLMQSAVFMGNILGGLTSSYLYAAMGTANLVLTAACISIASFLFCVFAIQESVQKIMSGGGIRTILDLSLVKDMVQTCVKRRLGYGRLVILLLIVANFIDLFVVYGVASIEYLYTRQKLLWTLTEFTRFNAINNIVMVSGLFFGIAFLQKLCKINDQVTTLISYVSCALEGIVRALAYATWVMYFGSLISVFRGLSFPLIRSIISKRVSAQDVAKIFALMSALDATLPLVSPVFYNTIYRVTLASLPGTAFILNTGLYVICIVLMWTAWRLIMRHPIQKEAKDAAGPLN